jgi:electron transfer flavoprotein alpha subunit
MSGVLVIAEHAGGTLHRMSLEAITAAQQLGTSMQLPVSAAVLGHGVENLARGVAAYALDRIHALDHELLGQYTPDGFVAALEQLIRATQPQYVILPHTYQVRDYAPKLATRFGQVLVSDAIEFRADGGSLTLVRQLFQGKLNADVRFTGPAPWFTSVQAGAWRADQVASGTQPAPVESFAVQLDPGQIRTRPEDPFREVQRAVDLSTADLIVSVGRGIREQEHLGLVEDLAKALGAELAASRPICDNGWLPMERQVGSSGQTVAPKLYLAVGISGAIQHLVGMKGAKTIIAINKDPEAPIFEVADYGVVGDLFDVVPALTEAIRKAKS